MMRYELATQYDSRKVEEVYLGNKKWENRLTRKLENVEWFLGKAEEYRAVNG